MAKKNPDTIREALRRLDPQDKDQWTSDGVPLVEVVGKMSGITDLKRSDINEAAPEFTRDSPRLPGDPDPSAQDDVGPAGDAGASESGSSAEGGADPAPATPGQAGDPPDSGGPELAGDDPAQQAEEEQDERQAQLADLDKRMRVGEERLQDIRRRRDELQKEEQQVIDEMDNIIRERDQLGPKQDNMNAILEYQRSQNELRLQRAERRQQALKGVDPRDLSSQSQLDQSMARKNQRGAKRPERQPMTETHQQQQPQQ